MRQTTRAVALLLALESTQAADLTGSEILAKETGFQDAAAFWNGAQPATATNRLASRTAAYAIVKANNTWGWTTTSYQTAKAVDTSTNWTAVISTNVLAAGSTCVNCVAGGTGVWCSRTFSYWLTASYDYQYTLTAGDEGMNSKIQTQTDIAKGQYDGGSCCNTKTLFLALANGTATDWTFNKTQTAAGAVTGVAPACAATANASLVKTGSGDNAWAATTLDIDDTAFTSWWCSNGLYKTLTATSTGSQNGIQVWEVGSNQRLELALVGCPQRASLCGGGADHVQQVTSSAVNIAVAATALGLGEKCTWVGWSYAYAPTFAMTDASSKGITTGNWQIHTMEYVGAAAYSGATGALQENASTTGYQPADTALSVETFLPTLTMPAVQFATLRTWYGAGGADGVTTEILNGYPSNWYAPGMQSQAATAAELKDVAGQQWGNVSHFPASGYYSASTAPAAGSGATYGAVGSSRFDARVVRYMPAQVAQAVWTAGNALMTQYAGELNSYNTAKATWDAYVAILTKNSKMDAFAAAFSPPKAPTVPPLPNKPWTPNKYSGYVKMTPAQKATMVKNSAGATTLTQGAQPTAQQFWTSLDAAQTIGGWGVFTAQIFTYRAGYGKSFGTIGYSGESTSGSLSAVWNYVWTCSADTQSNQGPTEVCDQTFTPSSATQTSADLQAASSGRATTGANGATT